VGTFSVFILLAIIAFWAAFIYFDKNRIRRHFDQSGDVVIDIWWRPIKHGWTTDALRYGDGNRIYEVRYEDPTATLHRVWCKTSLLNGVAADGDEMSSPTMEADSISAKQK